MSTDNSGKRNDIDCLFCAVHSATWKTDYFLIYEIKSSRLSGAFR